MTFPGQMKHVAETLLGEASVQVHGSVHDHVVVAQRGVRVAFIEAVVNQERAVVMMRHPTTDVHGGILMHPKQRLEPDHDGSFANRCPFIGRPAASLFEMLRQVHATKTGRWLI